MPPRDKAKSMAGKPKATRRGGKPKPRRGNRKPRAPRADVPVARLVPNVIETAPLAPAAPLATPPPGCEPFLRTILDDPAADAPRLVYADWLEEQGDPRAEFIRVQCEIAGLAEDDRKIERLSDRESQLSRAHGDRWRAEMPEWARAYCEFRRGFVSEVTIFGAWHRHYGPALSRLAPIEKVTLQNFHETTEQFIDGPGVRHLSALAILDALTPVEAFKSLVNSRTAVAALRTLQFFGMRATADSKGLANGDAAANLLAISRHLARLNRLELIHCGLHAFGIQRLTDGESMGNLAWIDLSQNNLDDACIGTLVQAESMRSLTHLILNDNQISNTGMQLIVESPQLENLTHLEIAGNDVGDRAIAPLIERFPRLRHLSIGRRFLNVTSQLALHEHYGKRLHLVGMG